MAGEFWLIGGPNGAGKTTALSAPWLREMLRQVHFLNADDRTLEKLKALGWENFASAPAHVLREQFIAAAEEVERELADGIGCGEAVGTETVLSTMKYQPLVERVCADDGVFGFIYIALNSPELSARRVARRVGEGGHDVPADKFAARWQRSVANVGWYARRATSFVILDNSDSQLGTPARLIARGGGGRLELIDPDAIPAITASLTAAFSTEN